MKPYLFYSQSNISVGGDTLDAHRSIFGDRMGDLIQEIPANSLVIPRFRAIPFGKELEQEIALRGSKLINSYHQHRAIADLFNWAYLLGDLTASAEVVENIPHLPEGAYFVKGETNSKKADWFSSAYAPDKESLIRVVGNLMQDSYIQGQRIVIRPFQKFVQLGTQVDGRPYFNERRAFIYKGNLLSEAFYWSSFIADGGTAPLPNEKYFKTLEKAINLTKHLSDFYVIDMGQLESGDWQVIELNDGPMTGLSENTVEGVFGALINEMEKE